MSKEGALMETVMVCELRGKKKGRRKGGYIYKSWPEELNNNKCETGPK